MKNLTRLREGTMSRKLLCELKKLQENMMAFCDKYEQDNKNLTSFKTGAFRDNDSKKARPELISPFATHREAEWMREGAEKYDDRNWEKGFPFSRCLASLERHVISWKSGDRTEDHLAAIRANAGFIMHYEEMIKRGGLDPSLNDMPKYEKLSQKSPERVPETGEVIVKAPFKAPVGGTGTSPKKKGY